MRSGVEINEFDEISNTAAKDYCTYNDEQKQRCKEIYKLFTAEHYLESLYDNDSDLVELADKKSEPKKKALKKDGSPVMESDVFTWCKQNLRDCQNIMDGLS